METAINELYQKAEQIKALEMTKMGCDGCTKIAYLESTGTQYIDTGVTSDIDLKFLIDAKINDDLNSKNVALFGGYSGGNYANFVANSNSSQTGWIIQFSPNWRNYVMLSTKDNNRHIHIVDLLNKIYSIDNINYNISCQIDSVSNGTIFVYAVNSSGNIGRITAMNLYKFQIWKNNVLIRDYIPVLDSYDRPCLFDKVSKTCFYNAGTGEFLYG